MNRKNSSQDKRNDILHADIAGYAFRSEQGARQSQQDSVYVGTRDDRLLAAVCDGMGGMQGGGQASKLAVGMLQGFFLDQKIINDAEFFRNCVQEIDRAIYHLWDGDKPLRAGSTIAAVMINERELTWLSVGDSRIYLNRKEELICPVPEHNYWFLLNEKLKRGQLDLQQYRRESTRPDVRGLVSYLGIGGVEWMEINPRPLQLSHGDKLMVCSDGLYRNLKEDEILSILQKDLSITDRADQLVEQALFHAGNRADNTTAVLIEIV